MNELNWWRSLLADDPLPGQRGSGVPSAAGCYPRTMTGGKGAKLMDLDGREQTDYCLANGSLILGHPEQEFLRSVAAVAERAVPTVARKELESRFSDVVREAFPSMEWTHFSVSSNDSLDDAIRTARHGTGREDIIWIAPGRPGTHQELGEEMTTLPFNDLDALITAPALRETAAIVMEPVPCFPGPVAPEGDYLRAVREIATDHGIMLVFDERTTGFRMAMGGAQERYHVVPDLTVLGRTAGGGLPIGICGGTGSPIDDASNGVNGTAIDPMTFAAGLETVKRLRSEGHDRLNEMGERMGKGLEAVLNEFHVRYTATAVGSMFQVFLDLEDRPGNVRRRIPDLYLKVQQRLLDNGVYFSPMQRGTNFISTAHTAADIDDAVSAVLVSLGEIAL